MEIYAENFTIYEIQIENWFLWPTPVVFFLFLSREFYYHCL